MNRLVANVISCAALAVFAGGGCDRDSTSMTRSETGWCHVSSNEEVSRKDALEAAAVASANATAQQHSLAELSRSLSRSTSELIRAETALVSSKQAIPRLRHEITRLRHEEKSLRSGVKETEIRLAQAQRDLRTFASTVEAQKTLVRQQALADADESYGAAIVRYSEARRQRNELRRRIGARREDQSEAQKEMALRRDARLTADAAAYAAVTREDSRVLSRIAAHRKCIDDAIHLLGANRTQLHQCLDNIQLAKIEVAAKQDSETLLPERILALEQESSRLQREIAFQQRIVTEAQTTATRMLNVVDDVLIPNVVPVARMNSRAASQHSVIPTSPYFAASYKPRASSDYYVSPHVRRNGSFVTGHFRTSPDDSFRNNWSSYGNVNPYTGKRGSNRP